MFITPIEIFDMILMTLVVGFVFKDTFKDQYKKTEDALEKYLRKTTKFNWDDFYFAIIVAAPANIVHELGHKIVALSFGFSAEFNASYFWLAIVLILKLISFPILFFVPAYVSIIGNPTDLEQVLTAFAGPFINLLLFLTAWIVLKTHKKIKLRTRHIWTLTKQVNLFLLIFNLLPIPGFDGFTVFYHIGIIIGIF